MWYVNFNWKFFGVPRAYTPRDIQLKIDNVPGSTINFQISLLPRCCCWDWMERNLNSQFHHKKTKWSDEGGNRTIRQQSTTNFSFPSLLSRWVVYLCLNASKKAYRISFSPLSSPLPSPHLISRSPPFRPTTSFIAREHRTREIRTFRSMALFYDRKDSLLLRREKKRECWKQRHGKLGRKRSNQSGELIVWEGISVLRFFLRSAASYCPTI